MAFVEITMEIFRMNLPLDKGYWQQDQWSLATAGRLTPHVQTQLQRLFHVMQMPTVKIGPCGSVK